MQRKDVSNSNTSSQLSQNKSRRYIDRSTCVQKAKPTRERPNIQIKDDESDIYEGDSPSLKESDYPNEDSDEFEEVDEVYQTINSSNFNDMTPAVPIEEALSEEESSNELRKQQIKINDQKQHKNRSVAKKHKYHNHQK